MAEERMLNDEILLGLIKANSGGGGGGTTDYSDLSNKPQINSVTLSGNKSASDLGLVASVDGKGLSTNDYTDADKAIVGGVTAALASKQDALTAGDYIEIDDGEISVNPVVPNENVTYEFKTKDASGSDATVTLIKKSGDTVISSTDYRYESVMGNKYITVDDLFYFGYSTPFTSGNWGYKLLAASADHAVDYTRTWGYNDTVDYTENFTSIDHSGESLVLKAQMDTALSGKQDTLTFDDTPTDNSNNPVKSNGVYDALATKANASDVTDALALKQDKTDNTLQTTSKTVVGGINELKSGLTNLDNEVNGDATVYPYADVITIEDAIPSNLADCSAKIEPVQDLHGQSAPYVGGAGKNKLPLVLATLKSLNTDGTWNDNVYALNNGTITVNTDDGGNITSIKANGTFNDATDFMLCENFILSTSCIMNGCPADGGIDKFVINWKTNANDTGEGAYIANPTTGNVRIQIMSGVTVSNKEFYPMIRLATETDATFAPYTNICPISGHTEASVQRDGVNLLNVRSVTREYNDMWTTIGGTLYSMRADGTLVLNAGTYTFSLSAIASSISIRSITGSVIASSSDSDRLTFTFASKQAIKISYGQSGGTQSFTAQIEVGSAATPYVPYAGKTYTIALGDTIYGGTVDFDSGVMTVTHGYCKVPSNVEWTYRDTYGGFFFSEGSTYAPGLKANSVNISNMLETVTDISTFEGKANAIYTVNELNFKVSGINTVSDFETWLDNNDLYICYELATPTTVNLTPQQIQLLKGQNTLTASTGQISVTVNGVSGSIGAVQEQVNELAEDVADVQNDLTALGTTIQSAVASTSGCVVKYVQIGKLVIVMANIAKGSSSWNVAHDLPRPLVSGYVGYTVDNYLPKYPLYMNDDNGNGRLQVRTGDTIASTDPVYFSYVAL